MTENFSECAENSSYEVNGSDVHFHSLADDECSIGEEDQLWQDKYDYLDFQNDGQRMKSYECETWNTEDCFIQVSISSLLDEDDYDDRMDGVFSNFTNALFNADIDTDQPLRYHNVHKGILHFVSNPLYEEITDQPNVVNDEPVHNTDEIPNNNSTGCKKLFHDEAKKHGLCDDYFRPQMKVFQVDVSLKEKDSVEDLLQPEVCILFYEWDVENAEVFSLISKDSMRCDQHSEVSHPDCNVYVPCLNRLVSSVPRSIDLNDDKVCVDRNCNVENECFIFPV